VSTVTGPRQSGWSQPVSVPDDLRALRGGIGGHIHLPISVYSSGAGPARVFHLDDEAERVELYQILLTNGRAADQCQFLNLEELIRLWPRLWLSPQVRQACSARLGELGAIA
jgi:hypothetical protein